MVLLPKDIDVSQINVSKPNVLDNGAKLIYVNYTGEKKFRIQTPKMSLPFGLNEYTEGPYPKYSTELSYKESQSTDPKEIKNNEKIKQFHDKMIEIENRLIDLAVENSGPWFKLKNANREIISSKFLPPIVKVSKDKDGEPDGKYPPTSKLKIYNKDGEYVCEDNCESLGKWPVYFNDDGKIIDLKYSLKPKSTKSVISKQLCRFVLEVNEKTILNKNIKIGDYIKINKIKSLK